MQLRSDLAKRIDENHPLIYQKNYEDLSLAATYQIQSQIESNQSSVCDISRTWNTLPQVLAAE